MNSNPTIRQYCDDLSNPNITEENLVKILTKFLV